MLNESSVSLRPGSKLYRSSVLGCQFLPAQGTNGRRRTLHNWQASFDKENTKPNVRPSKTKPHLRSDEPITKSFAQNTSFLKHRSSQSMKKEGNSKSSQTLNGFRLRLQMKIEDIHRKSRRKDIGKQGMIAEIDDNKRVLIRSV